MTAIVCVFLVCAAAEAAWLFWLFRLPRVSRAEYDSLAADVSKLKQQISSLHARSLGK